MYVIELKLAFHLLTLQYLTQMLLYLQTNIFVNIDKYMEQKQT